MATRVKNLKTNAGDSTHRLRIEHTSHAQQLLYEAKKREAKHKYKVERIDSKTLVLKQIK